MDERTSPTTVEETTATRRVIAKGAAAAGLSALFAAVATGRVLADDDQDTIPTVDDSPDTSPDLDDSPDTTPDDVDQADTTPDDGETTNDTHVKSVSKKSSRSRGRGRKKGHR